VVSNAALTVFTHKARN